MSATASTVAPATLFGVPLSLISLVTLTCQNSALTIVLHYSRISVPADQMYSAAEAVLLNELLKGSISLSIAFYNALRAQARSNSTEEEKHGLLDEEGMEHLIHNGNENALGMNASDEIWTGPRMFKAISRTGKEFGLLEIVDPSLSLCRPEQREITRPLRCVSNGEPSVDGAIIPQLQFVAASNLDVPTFQVTYNLKILTTALFSVILLRKKLTPKKWLALLCLAAGVGVVQLQSTVAKGSSSSAGHADMDRFKGLLAVGAACMTSGLAGVYFELVLKGSKVDLWVRNVQLSFFSLLPALLPVFFPDFSLFGGGSAAVVPSDAANVARPLFAYFGLWAWAVVLIQVLGGLVTALVIKFSDNIMKGFATSLAIILSFIAGVILFNFQVTASFLVGTCIVVGATYLYNQPDTVRPNVAANQFPLASVQHFIPTPSGIATPPRSSGGSSSSHHSSYSGSNGASSYASSSQMPATHRRTHQHQGSTSASGSHTPDISIFPNGAGGILDQSVPASPIRKPYMNGPGSIAHTP